MQKSKAQENYSEILRLAPGFASVSFTDVLRVSPFNLVQIKGRQRSAELILWRRVLAIVAFGEAKTLGAAGLLIKRDHVTVCYHLDQAVNGLAGYNPDFKKVIDSAINLTFTDRLRSTDGYVDSLLLLENILLQKK